MTSPCSAARVTAFVALGSNLGDREAHLTFGLRALAEAAGIEVEAVSRVYETEPVGPPQGAYLNAVVKLETTLSPHALLAVLQSAEVRDGRTRDAMEPLAARTLDLDLLLYGGEQIDAPGLVVPHPRMHERAFVLVPLADVAAEVVHPVLGAKLGALAALHAGCPGVRRWPRDLPLSPEPD